MVCCKLDRAGRKRNGEKMRKYLGLILVFGVSACGYASDAVNSDVSATTLQNSTASYFETNRQNVYVSKFKPGVLGTEYEAQVLGRTFDCHYFRSSVSCIGAEKAKGTGFSY